jgi:hypothetical protein
MLLGTQPIEFCTDDELLDEFCRRFSCGVLLVEREHLKGPGELYRRWRCWGNATWGVGAVEVLRHGAMGRHDAIHENDEAEDA